MTASPDDDGKPGGGQGGSTVTPRWSPGKPGAGGAAPKSPDAPAGQASNAPGKAGPAGSSALSPSATQAKPGTEPVKSEPPRPADKPGAPGAPAKAEPTGGAPGAAKPVPSGPGRNDAAKADPAKADPAKTDPAKTEAAKPDPGKAEAAKPAPPGATSAPASGSAKSAEPTKPEPSKADPKVASADPKVTPAKPEPARPEPAKVDPLKTGATGSSAIPPGAPAASAGAKPEAPAKAAATGSSAIGGGPAKPGTGPGAGASAAGAAAGAAAAATRVKPEDRLTDGPILDMKSERPAEKAASKDAGKDLGKGPDKPAADPAVRKADGGPGYGAVAASGLVGGAVGAGLLYLLASTGALAPKADATRLDALDKRIAALATNDSVVALDKRVGANETALKPLPEAVGKAEAAAKTATERADQALQKAGGAPNAEAPAGGETKPAAAGVPADLAARLDALDQRVSALQEEPGREPPADPNKLTATQNGDQTVRLADLDERLKALETKAQAQGAPAVPEEDLAPKVAKLQSDLDARAKANEGADKALGERLDKLQQSLESRVQANTEAVQQVTQASRRTAEADKQQAEEAAKAVDRRLQEQGDRIAALDKAVDGSAKAATVQAALRVVALDRVLDALDTGSAYADALGALRGGDPGDGARYEPLAAFADTGAPTTAALAAEFRPIADGIAAERRAAKARTAAQSGGIGDRLMSMAESMVQVKRVAPGAASGASGAPAGTAPPADEPEAAVQDALDRGRVAEAAKAFDALPEAVRAPAKAFGERLKAVAAAHAAARSLQSEAFKGLAAPAAAR